MRLLRAKFTNFRLLRDLELDLRLGDDRTLVVLRAENESGKTTILNALQWGLYGDDALPRGRGTYRLHPIDWDLTQGNRVDVSVEIEFERTVLHQTRSGETHPLTEQYRLIRTTTDTVSGDSWQPGVTNALLFLLTPRGDEPIVPPEARVQELLPKELRGVFFTDGDRALSFIEADVAASTKQTKVRESIRNLLGLDVLEDARLRVKKAYSAVNSKVRAQLSDAQLQETTEQIARLESQVDDYQDQLEDAEAQFAEFDQESATAERRLEELIARGGGDRQRLAGQHEATSASIQRLDQQIKAAAAEHSMLFGSLELTRDLLVPTLASSFAFLDELRDRGDIPNSTIPVLQDLLRAEICICGERLDGESSDVAHRKEHIQGLIDRAQYNDAAKSIATNLYFASSDLQPEEPNSSSWLTLFSDVAGRRDGYELDRKNLGTLLASLEAQIEMVPATDIDEVRRHRNFCRERRDHFNGLRMQCRQRLAQATQDLANARNRREALLRRLEAGQLLVAELEAASDLEAVLNSTYNRLTDEELQKVSSSMNSMFLDMIVADSQQSGRIQRAEISNYEIMVYGSEGHPLNPEVDLNGASRRALTLAFILALTKVSEVEAPNVIDTPLGMMSGHVKESVLIKAIRESSQLILFLTKSEIEGCQSILDSHASKVMTLTNPAHYPRMLVHPRDEGQIGIVRCDCDHRSSCRICQRTETL